jgi:hypothetical protein
MSRKDFGHGEFRRTKTMVVDVVWSKELRRTGQRAWNSKWMTRVRKGRQPKNAVMRDLAVHEALMPSPGAAAIISANSRQATSNCEFEVGAKPPFGWV